MKNKTKKLPLNLTSPFSLSDFALWKKMDQYDEISELWSSDLFLNMATNFVAGYEEKVDMALELQSELFMMIEFGHQVSTDDHSNFTNTFVRFLSFQSELDAGKPIYTNFVNALCRYGSVNDLKERDDIYPCMKDNLESHLQYVLENVDTVLSENHFMHFAQMHKVF